MANFVFWIPHSQKDISVGGKISLRCPLGEKKPAHVASSGGDPAQEVRDSPSWAPCSEETGATPDFTHPAFSIIVSKLRERNLL